MKNQDFFEKSIVYLGIGSNLGDKRGNIIKSFLLLSEIIENIETSSLYETEPLYRSDQPCFLNTVFRGIFSNKPEILLVYINEIEKKLGRDRKNSGFKGPRTIDIDILLFGKTVLNTDKLIIPHPGIKERLFVLKPLLELESNLSDPLTGINYTENMKTLDNQGIYYFESCRYIENQTKTG